MITKIIIITSLILILFFLMSGLFYLVKDQGKSNRVAKSLSLRVAFSVILFIFILVAFYFGWLPK